MRTLLLLIAVLTSGLKSPKDQANQPRAIVPPIVTRIPFGWDAYVMPQAKMYLRFGPSIGVYTNVPIEVTGLTNYTMTLTNWSERKQRHWYGLEVPQIGQSRSIPWSRLPPTRVALTWTNPPPVTIRVVHALSDPWVDLATIWTTNYFDTPITGAMGFYDGQPATRLWIKAFNPLNDQ